MTYLFMMASVLALSISLIHLFRDYRQLFSFSLIASLVFVGYLSPQVFNFSLLGYHSEDAKDLFLIYALMCLLAVFFGENLAPASVSVNARQYVRSAMIFYLIFLSFFGLFFYYKLRALPQEVLMESQWAGVAVLYNFFYRSTFVAFLIAFILWLELRQRIFLFFSIICVIPMIDSVVLGVRRQIAFDLFFYVVGSIWFVRRKRVSLALVCALFLFGFLVNSLIAPIRGAIAIYRFNLAEFEISEVYNDLMLVATTSEDRLLSDTYGTDVENAVSKIWEVWSSDGYSFGIVYYNQLIARFVPRQIVGSEFKESLQFSVPVEPLEDGSGFFKVGSTFTGFSDSFASFGLLGFFVFGIASVFVRRMFILAESGELRYQVMFLFFFSSLPLAITHQTFNVISGIINFFVFGWPLFLAGWPLYLREAVRSR